MSKHSLQLQLQNIALQALHQLRNSLQIGRNEIELVQYAEEILKKYGVTQSWPGSKLVIALIGDRSSLCQHEGDYRPTNHAIAKNDVISLTLNPWLDGYTASAGYSYVWENNRLMPYEALPEWAEGVEILRHLYHHAETIAHPQMTLCEFYSEIQQEINRLKYENLDYRGYIGHEMLTMETPNPDSDHTAPPAILQTQAQRLEVGNHTYFHELNYFCLHFHLRRSSQHRAFKQSHLYHSNNQGIHKVGGETLLRYF